MHKGATNKADKSKHGNVRNRQRDHFQILCSIGRPAAGKSEISDYLKKTSEAERVRRFHIAPFEEIDDFPMLWAWFEEDRILAEMGKPRLHTDDEGYFKDEYLWHLLIRRLDLEYRKKTGRRSGIRRRTHSYN